MIVFRDEQRAAAKVWSVWEGRIYSGGWVPGSGGEYDAVEPATGNTLGRVGTATPADVHKAAERAAQAQREWAGLTYDRRAEEPTCPEQAAG